MYKLVFVLFLLSIGARLSAESIWMEGEEASSSKVIRHPWWYDKVKKDVLSGGEWLSHFNDKKEGSAIYTLNVEKTADYTFWLRANPTQVKLDYRLNGGGWQNIDMNKDLRGKMNIADDNKPDIRYIAWIKVGKMTLEAGEQKLEFRFLSANSHHGAIDCFCLTTDAWVPSGTTKPGASALVTEEALGPEDAIWIEGEDANKTQATANSWYNSVKSDVLSGGLWQGHMDKKTAAKLSYDFEVIEAGDYNFWIRANPLRTKVIWTLDQEKSQVLDWNTQRENMNIAKDNKPDMRFIAWGKAGVVPLKPGQHHLEIQLDRADENIPFHGAIDVMALVRVPWTPNGKKRPSRLMEAAIKEDTWFAVVGDIDELSKDSIIDVSKYIEAPAGHHGFLKQDGENLRFEKSKTSSKFWAIGSSSKEHETPEEMDHRAQWYRKHGINLVRQHTVISASGLLDAQGQFDKEKIDHYDRWFAACKRQGIYTTWSVVYPHHGKFLRENDGLSQDKFKEIQGVESQKNSKSSEGITSNDYINIDRELQDIVLKYFDALLNHVNPYTQLAYKDDPSLAIVEFQNESNIFFHTMNRLLKDSPIYGKIMRQGFFEWTKSKYGSKAAVAKAWDNKWQNDDRWEDGELAIMAAFHWGDEGPMYDFKDQFTRTGDYLRFLVSLQKGYYDRREKELRGIGFKGVTVTTAWRGIGSSSLANLYCDTAADMIDRHNYYGGGEGGHVIFEGKISNKSHLEQPGRGLLVLGLSQVANRPFGVSEWSMMPPSPCKAEAAPLMAFYGMGLQGWDASYHFATSQERLGDGWPNLGKYASNTPHYMGQFPALAMAIYRGDIQEGQVVASRAVSDADIFAGKDVLKQSLGGEHDNKEIRNDSTTAPETLAIGKVLVDFESKTEKALPLDSYWDKNKKTLKSTTGELSWDYGQKLVEVRSDKTQAVIGYAGGQKIDLPALTVEIKTEFVSLIFTSLDDLALAESKHILVTAMARDKQSGSEFNEDWSRLIKVGGPPLMMEPVQAIIKWKGSAPKSVKAVDIYGVPTDREVKVDQDGSFSIDGRQRAYYYEIKR